ncbi:hypothetical protein AX16_000738 [Volvariella volvacea WC 439]|nr:hypothetical protein AX16_000738 [Volvariella volvacea WC 439]
MHGVNQVAHATQLELRVIPSSTLATDQPPAQAKQRKVDRACDACRRRKTRCDGPRMANNVCSNCLQLGKPCTYVEASKPRGPPKAYITGLEDRMEMLEALLEQLQPGVDYSNELGPPVVRDSWKNEDSSAAPPAKSAKLASSSSLNKQRSFSSIPLRPVGNHDHHLPTFIPYRRHPSSPPPLVSSIPGTTGLSNYLILRPEQPRERSRFRRPKPEEGPIDDATSDGSSSDVEVFQEVYTGGVKRLTLQGVRGPVVDAGDNNLRYHGKSSAHILVDATRRFKEMHLLGRMEDTHHKRAESSPSPHARRRAEFWRAPKWELLYEGLHTDSPEVLTEFLERFPPEDLARSLIDLHFKHVNPHFALLHRPTFERQWEQKLHHRDLWYACLCLSLFGVASRWSDDPRVLLDTPDPELKKDEISWSSAGWKYFAAGIDIHRSRRSLLYPATLFEIQAFTLLGMFLRGTSSPSSAWIIVSIGIRKAQDTGALRRSTYQDHPSIDEELWKRAVWCLIILDRIGSTTLGRGCSINEEDFDLDLPLEVDDEYWEAKDGRAAFEQPPDVPSKVQSFTLLIHMTQILSFTLKTIYAVNKNKVFSGSFSHVWQVEILSQLDRAMKDWLISVPKHLKWSEEMDDFHFSNQATTLYASYYLTQMNIYRPFISRPQYFTNYQYHLPSTQRVSDEAFKICMEASHALARIINVQRKRGYTNTPNMCTVAHMAAGMLSWSVWDLKVQERVVPSEDLKAKVRHQIERCMKDIEICIEALEWAEKRWPAVTALLEKLRESLPSDADQMTELSSSARTEDKKPFSATTGRMEGGKWNVDSIYTHSGYEPQSWRPPRPQPDWQWQDLNDPSASTSWKAAGEQHARGSNRIGQHSWSSPYDARPDPATYLQRELSKLHSFSDTREPDSHSLYTITSQEPWSSTDNLNSFSDRPFSSAAPPSGDAAPSSSSRESSVMYISNSMRRTSFPTTELRHQPVGGGRPGQSDASDVAPSNKHGGLKYDDANMHRHEQYYHDNRRHVAGYRHRSLHPSEGHAPLSVPVTISRSDDPAATATGSYSKERSGTVPMITPPTTTWNGGLPSRSVSTSSAFMTTDFPLRPAYQPQSQVYPPLPPHSSLPVTPTTDPTSWNDTPYSTHPPPPYPPPTLPPPPLSSSYSHREPSDSYSRSAYNSSAPNYSVFRPT